MIRHFGIQSRRTSPAGAFGTDPAATRNAILPRDSILLAASAPTFERSQILQALLDVLAVGFAFLFISVAGVGLAFAFFVGFFVKL